jgi:hypothetical protein
MVIVPMTMLIKIILVDFFQVVLVLVDLGRAMGMAIRAMVLSMVTVLSHRASAYHMFGLGFRHVSFTFSTAYSIHELPIEIFAIELTGVHPEQQRA